jgi:hypothetical protein
MFECSNEAAHAFTAIRKSGMKTKLAMRRLNQSKEWFERVQHAKFDSVRCGKDLKLAKCGCKATNNKLGHAALTETFVVGTHFPFSVNLQIQTWSLDAFVFSVVPVREWETNPGTNLNSWSRS